ncbi:hypothetical protein BDV06DRAFT_65521 [Aspergillus oleicola]
MMNPSYELGRHPSTHNIMLDVVSRYSSENGDNDGYHKYSAGNDVSIITKLIQLIRRRLSSKRASLTTLPNGILINIFNSLPLLDQACLTLTCKSFHFIFNSVFEDERLKFPRLYQLKMLDSPSIPALDLPQFSREANSVRNSLGQTRRHLLTRLEDRRLKYCVKCMKLHRRESFAQPTYHGPMVYRKYCWTEAGVVDLCPCITLTIRDKARIVRCLRRMKKGKGPLLDGGLEKVFRAVDPSQVPGAVVCGGSMNILFIPETLEELRTPSLVHECSTNGNGLVEGSMKTVISMQGNGSSPMLVAETDYNISMDRRVFSWRPSEGFKDALYNLLWAMRMSERGVLFDEYDSFGRSQPRAENGAGDGGERKTEWLREVRSLGRCDAPVDGYWVRQDRLMSPSFLRLMHAYES